MALWPRIDISRTGATYGWLSSVVFKAFKRGAIVTLTLLVHLFLSFRRAARHSQVVGMLGTRHFVRHICKILKNSLVNFCAVLIHNIFH